MDRRQNNGSVKAVSPRHCPATCALRNCCFNCCAWPESQRQCPLHCCWWTTWTTRSKRSPTVAAQFHLPTHDLFWANLKVQLHLPPLRSLDLLISPGTMSRFLACGRNYSRRYWRPFCFLIAGFTAAVTDVFIYKFVKLQKLGIYYNFIYS